MSAMSDRPSEPTSSTVETTGAPVPAVPMLMTGRAAIFPVCTRPAMTTPKHHRHPRVRLHPGRVVGWRRPSVAAKMSPPMLGRMKVWMVSLIVSTAGILSRMISASSRAAPMPMAELLLIDLSRPAG